MYNPVSYKKYHLKHRERLKVRSKNYYEEHRDKILARSRDKYAAQKETARKRRLDNIDQYRQMERNQKRKQYQLNADRFKTRSKIGRRKYADWIAAYKNRPDVRLHSNISRAIRFAIHLTKAGRKWETLVGYSLQVLMAHLERKFKKGMSWDNYGKWEIDHIIPKSAFYFTTPDEDDFKRCWALDNLQPLWQFENRSKHNKGEEALQ